MATTRHKRNAAAHAAYLATMAEPVQLVMTRLDYGEFKDLLNSMSMNIDNFFRRDCAPGTNGAYEWNTAQRLIECFGARFCAERHTEKKVLCERCLNDTATRRAVDANSQPLWVCETCEHAIARDTAKNDANCGPSRRQREEDMRQTREAMYLDFGDSAHPNPTPAT